jgi:hypothetical protein
MLIKWNKSEEGYVNSKCGRFEIEPVFIGRTTPQGYNIYYRPTPTASRVRIKRYADTVRDAKALAEYHYMFNVLPQH